MGENKSRKSVCIPSGSRCLRNSVEKKSMGRGRERGPRAFSVPKRHTG